ncbi:MAG: hypothetical protein HY960_12770 [Ignavibacteriae bacterium]|nr:hypothetical protein [Ignavibacteriota bacterium]
MEAPKYDGHEDHAITLDAATSFTRNFRAQPKAPTVNGGYFSKDGINKILEQDGCIGIRMYYGLNNDGESCLVLVGVDTTGEDLYNGSLAEIFFPCPPYCPQTSPLKG